MSIKNLKNPRRVGTVEHTIWQCIYDYPSMFKDASDVLMHLWVVIGNGSDWVDGKLLYHDEIERTHESKFEGPHKMTGVGILKQLDVQHSIEVLKGNADVKFTLENIDLVSKWHDKPWKNLYPLSEYSAIMNIPKNANKSHQKYARIVIDKVYESLYLYPTQPNDRDWNDLNDGESRVEGVARRQLRNIEFADKATAKMDKFFGKREGRENGYERWRSFAGYVRHKNKTFKGMQDILKSIY